MASRTAAKGPENHVVGPGALREAIQTVAERVADMIRQAPTTRVRLPRSNWTVGEAAAHLAITQGQFREWLEGATSPQGDGRIEEFAAVNAQSLADFRERDGARLADLIATRTQAFLAASGRYPEHHMTRLHSGTWDLPTCMGSMLCHLLMHACPIAIALHRPLPVEPAHLALLFPFFKAAMKGDISQGANPRLNACLEVRVRGGRRFAIQFENGHVTVEDAPTKRVDCYLSADPVAFLLVAVGIVSQWGPIARGKLVAWGLKPWLALRLKSYLPNP
jgi:hypothetical protein